MATISDVEARLAPGAVARDRLRRVPRAVWPFVAFLLLFVIGGVTRSGLFSIASLWTTAAVAVILALASAGQTLAIIQGGIDLSIANTITVAALTYASAAQSYGPIVAFLLALLVGAVIGAVNGSLVAFLDVSPIVVTIAMNGLLFGVVLLKFDLTQLVNMPAIATDMTSAKISLFGSHLPAVIPVGLGVMLILELILTYSGWGRALYLIGSAPRMARLAGVRVAAMRISSYSLSGVLGAFAGMVIAAFYAQTESGMGDSYLLGSVAAVVVGGAAITGGSGSMFGTLGGALVLSQISTLIAAFNLSVDIQQLVYGFIILAVVAMYGRQRQ